MKLSGVARPAGEPVRAPCTGRLCIAVQANVALTTPSGPDVIVHVEAVDFWLCGDAPTDRVLVRPSGATHHLRGASSGSVRYGDAITQRFLEQIRSLAGVATNWYEQVLAVESRMTVWATLAWELDPTASGAVDYRSPPLMPVLRARRIG